MTRFARTDTSILGHWWWTIDRWSMAAVALLFVYGVMLTMAASPPVAERLHFEQFHFVRRQLVFLPLAIVIMFAVSLMTPRGIRRLAVMVFAVSILLMIATLFFGPEIKGARRWINIAGLSLQPSEFIKPSLAVVTAWAFARQHKSGEPVWRNVAIGLYVLVVGLLLLQPDFGMTVVVSAVWFGQFFLAGLPMMWVAGFLILGLLGAGGAYFALPHVASRIDRFIDPSSGDSYQVSRSMEAFMNGGLLGRGPGEGSVKSVLPDAHTDFVFAVAGEEFGLIACLLLVGLFAFIVLRGFARVIKEPDLFTLLAVTGLLVQFGLQSLVNMGSTLSLIPTKGMTLPFISYGGSSLTAIALLIGMVLALTRNRRGREAL
ncbi:MAG: cell division protein FtsW [Alphaproteobacteria bacterium]|jgi:cell division protein FtsW